MVKKNSIPDRWRSLTSVGQRVTGSRFIAFKVPLRGATNQRVTQNQKFTPKDLVNAIRSQNEELGMVIDLTNTERYYTTKDLPKSVQYVKLHTAGLKIPDDATIHQFKRVVRQFIFDNADNEKLIGVHCTTGINRTGYLICRYLIDVDGWRPLQTITCFAHCRGHPIEGAVYCEDLLTASPRSNVGIDLPLTEEEKKALSGNPEDQPRDRNLRDERKGGGDDFGDFDARGRRPAMRAGDSAVFPSREGRDITRNMLGDHDLRVPFEPPERFFLENEAEFLHHAEMLQRAEDFYGEEEFDFDPEMELRRRAMHGMQPRPLMEIEHDYDPREAQFEDPRMGHEGMELGMRARGRARAMRGMRSRPFPVGNPSSRPTPLFPRGQMNDPGYDEMQDEHGMGGDLDFRERSHQNEYFEEEDPSFDPRGQEAMADSYRGPGAERMHPRDPRALEGPMHDRDVRPMSDRMHPKDPRYMDKTLNERMYPGNVHEREGPMGERIPPRNARPMHAPMGDRAHAREAAYMEDPQYMEEQPNEQMNPRNPRGIKSLMGERIPPRDVRIVDGQVVPRRKSRFSDANETVHGAMDGSMNMQQGIVPARDPRHMQGSMNERMHPRAGAPPPRAGQDMASQNYERMHGRDSRAMDDNMTDQMYPNNNQMYPRDTRGMAGSMYPTDDSMNDQMYPSNVHSMEENMNDEMSQWGNQTMDDHNEWNAQAAEGSMNEWMPQRDGRAMGAQMAQRMPQRQGDYQVGKGRPADGPMHDEYYSDPRSYEGQKANPSQAPLRGVNRFAPYSQRKPPQAQQEYRGPPRPDPHAMGPPAQGGWYA